jgi:hypothetical protein
MAVTHYTYLHPNSQHCCNSSQLLLVGHRWKQ